MPGNLTSLMQIAPVTGAGAVGLEQALDTQTQRLNQQKSLQDIMAAQQKYDFDQQNNPLMLEHNKLVNTGAGIKNDTDALSLSKNKATYDSDVAATNSKNDLSVMENHIKGAEEQERKFGEWAGQMQTMDPMARGVYLSQQMKASGMDPSNPQVQQFVKAASTNPQFLSQSIEQMRQHRAEMSAAYIQALAVAKEHSRSAVQVANINGQTQRDVEQKRIDAGKYNRSKMMLTLDQRIDAAKSARERYSALVDAATQAKQAGDEEAFDRYRQRAEAAKPQAEAEIKATTPGSLNVGAMANIPTNAGPQIAPPGWNPNVPQPAAPANGGDLAAKLQSMGQTYEPDKYEYRIGPNGNIQRKPK